MGRTTTMNEWDLCSDYIPKRGDIVKSHVGVGVVVDVYTSHDTGRILLEIHYAKNAAQGQRPEFSPLGLMQGIDLAPATTEEFQAEMKLIFKRRTKQYRAKVKELLAYAGMEPIRVNSCL